MSAVSRIPLSCSVRGCGLELRSPGPSLVCERGHAFDVARSGYVNLLQPNERRSLDPGDTRAVVEARRRLADRGVFDALAQEIARLAEQADLPRDALVLDVGCGEGFHLARLAGQRSTRGIGVDISVHAVDLAARRHPGLAWVVANADRRIPLVDGTVDLALSITSRRPIEELARVIEPRGALVVAVPGPNDLAELRAHALGEARAIEGGALVESGLSTRFEIVATTIVTHVIEADRDDIAALAASSYRLARHRERDRLVELDRARVTLEQHVTLFVRR